LLLNAAILQQARLTNKQLTSTITIMFCAQLLVEFMKLMKELNQKEISDSHDIPGNKYSVVSLGGEIGGAAEFFRAGTI